LGDVEIELYANRAPRTVEKILKFVDGRLFAVRAIYLVVRLESDNGAPKIEVI